MLDRDELMMVELRKQLRLLRERRGMTQPDVADRMGTSFTQVSRIETGAVSPYVDSIMRYCNACRVNISRLMFLVETNVRRQMKASKQKVY